MADNKYLGTYHMVNDAKFEPMRKNNFELQITGLQDIDPMASRTIMLSVASFTAPTISLNRIDIRYGNNVTKFAGVPDFQDSTLTCNDFIGYDVEIILQKWFAKAYNPETQAMGLKKDYAKEAKLIEYDPAGNFVRQWTWVNCWLQNLNLGDFTQDGGNAARQVTCTFVYDAAVPGDFKVTNN